MNFVKRLFFIMCKSQYLCIVCLFLVLFSSSIYFVGCSDRVSPPSPSELTEFNKAGPYQLTVDESKLIKAKIGGGPYRIVQNEVLELTMPTILRVVTTEESVERETTAPYICRVSGDGTITLPVIGEIEVAGKTLAEVETSVIEAYYPEYAVARPSVFARVLEYNTAKVSISGAVNDPGVYSLRQDQMSLVTLLMEAGGIVDEGAVVIKINHSDNSPVLSDEKENTDKEQSLRSISVPINSVFADFKANHPEFSDVKIQLDYKLFFSSGRRGMFYVTYDKIILLQEQLDVTSETERLTIIKLLSKKEPWLPLTHIDQKMCELAELLEPGSGRYMSNINNRDVIDDDSSQSDVRIKKSDNWIYYGQSQKQIPQFITADIRYRSIYPERNRYGNGMVSVNQEIQKKSNDPNVEFKTSFIIQRDYHDINPNTGVLGPLAQLQNVSDDKQAPTNKKQNTESIVLPIRGLNIPFADIQLNDGDRVIVERLQIPLFTVIGLVNSPGNFEYPPDAHYNLIQALAFANGLNEVADPRYVTVYRLKPDGEIVSVIFKLIDTGRGPNLTDSFNISIKPGDIIFIENTPRTRTNLFLDRIFRINVGTYFNLNNLWENNNNNNN